VDDGVSGELDGSYRGGSFQPDVLGTERKGDAVNYCKHCGIHADEDECPKCGEWIAEEHGPNPEREHGESMNDHPK
jgi:hypothetical protein